MVKQNYTNFMTPVAGFLVPGRGHISHIVKTNNFIKIVFSTPGSDEMMTKEL